MTILALDLGTSTGFAVGVDGAGTVISGTWDLAPKRYEGGGMRYLNFRGCLESCVSLYGVTEIWFEEVRNHAGVSAAHAYGGFKATLESWCEKRRIPYSSVPVGTIKKSFTGKGNASKDDMILEARQRGYDPVDDNAADAIALLCYRMREEAARRILSEWNMSDEGKEDVVG